MLVEVSVDDDAVDVLIDVAVLLLLLCIRCRGVIPTILWNCCNKMQFLTTGSSIVGAW